MDAARIFEGLNDEQRSAVETVRGPLCILAGAGSGKTTTITRRIANQVAAGVFEPGQILAVTFTDKAAGEMRGRLETLGVQGVRARTFHSAALAQLRNLASESPGQILPSKAMALRQIANTLPKPYKFRPAADLATEVEWAKNRRIAPSDYLASLKDREPPIPADLMASVYKRYESGKNDRGLIDFEDLLELTIQMFQQDQFARERFIERYHAFTVDEYQDVNELQETLLREWLGPRDDLCVVGDDYQSIYGFTGATPVHLLRMPQRFPDTKVVRLELNYRSTPQVLAVANRLVPSLGGAEKVLRAVRQQGPDPQLRFFSAAGGEPKFVVDRVRALIAEKVPLEQIAILYRVNFRSEDYEEALAAANIPYQVRDGAFLSRRTARQMLGTLKRSRSTSVADEVDTIAQRSGYVESPSDDLGDQELTRQNDLARFIQLASEFDDGTRTCAEFAADIESRFGSEGDGRGVQLLTLHRAKGLEFEAVLLPRVEEGELPFRRSKSDEAVAEERRLLYVGITRAKTHLSISWVSDGKRQGSRFVGELRPPQRMGNKAGSGAPKNEPEEQTIAAAPGIELELSGGYSGTVIEVEPDGVTVELAGGGQLHVPYGDRVTSNGTTLALGPPHNEPDPTTLDALKKWRRDRAKEDGVPAFVVFHDSTLQEIASRSPESLDDLVTIPGIGPTKAERYGPQLLELLANLS
ncbi:MAG: ATP-dependent DNA helicase UvrD2 [Actinomycetota bacterium]